jgi:sugar O-acyltransferase (sialic acid O-acetyltransferase NeuD family)
MKTLYICGAGNSEGIRLAQSVNRHSGRWTRMVILDDDPAKRGSSILGVEIAGPFSLLEMADPACSEVVNMVGRTTLKRWSVFRKLEQYGLPLASLVHPSVETDGATLGEGVLVYQNATIGPLTTLGDGSVVMMGAVAGHGSTIGPSCILAPNAVVNARVQMGEGVYLGTNGSILPELKVGDWATIGVCTGVISDIPAGATVLGVPGRIMMTLELKVKTGGLASIPPPLRDQLQNGAVRTAV